MTEFLQTTFQYLQQNWLEVSGVITGFICVYLNARENIWGWPMGIISCFLYIFIMYQAQFYADMWLQVVYVFLNAYGWYEWLYGGANKQALTVSHILPKEILILLPAGILLIGGAYYYFDTQTDAVQPFWDSFNTAFSLVAIYLQAKKRLESWLVWITVDIIYIPLFYFRGLYPTAGLYLAYLVLAAVGYLLWRKSMLKQVSA
ncbi:nicotinamide mononucleotide transporter [Rhodocytophaga rosea]|uniref:Nicotinamide riboside transporter PnuC n=1 Tax=Rhodocytophaga rosea TaxID=2704465 RepID=A0A6C0GKW0_9BACT|nr:nicotinamide riboside transporter PnuC [Rhodocytophaga rosea]QHT68282.1 nicotinamide mononucleotide transporter [Rhodocytophaga rosea]